MMPRDTERDEQTLGLAENRAHPRVNVHSLAYIELGEGNAGLILNISETGIAIQAVESVSTNYLPRMHFRLPKTEFPIQISGKVVWQIKSKKEVGIEFDAISDQARDVIRKWIAAEENRQTESEEIHQRTLEEFVKPVSQATAFQKYPSESGDEDLEVPVPTTPSEPSTIDSPPTEAEPENFSSVAEVPRILETAPPLQFPAPGRLPDRWRPEPKILATHAAIERPPTDRGSRRIFGAAAWNPQPTVPNFGIEPTQNRPWWPYVLVVILLVAVGAAGVTTFDPGLADSARIQAWLVSITSPLKLKHAPPNGATQTQQANATSPNASPSTAAQVPAVPPATQPNLLVTTQNGSANVQSNEPSNAAPTGATRTSEAPGNNTNVPSAQQPVPTTDSGRSDASELNPAATTGSSQPASGIQSQTQSGAAYGGNEVPTRSIQNLVPPTNRSAGSQRSLPADTRVSSRGSEPSPQTANSPNQTVGRRAHADSEALQAWRAQTTLPSPSSSAPTSTSRAPNRAPARQSNLFEDANANSAPYVASRSGAATQSPSTAPQVFVVEMPGYPTIPVPPSTPLGGVPSGSVAANSQLHAIWVPTNLEWAQQYLPGNLGVGRLLSSYSPAYPSEAAREGIQGTVKLDVTVATDGTVRSVHVLAGPAILAQAAASAVRDWRYGASFLAGQPVETQQYVSLTFRLTPAR
ncbi:MAG TPA: TonB family protein [Candidatus Acidoferrum sp.]|nr:TonB family protein [Candidatus Acidoferrum sp.]